MKAVIIPASKIGKIAVILIAIAPILFIAGGALASGLYANVPAPDSIFGDFSARPLLAISMLLGMISALSAFVCSLFSFFKLKERALLIFVPLYIGASLIIFLIGEFVVPH